MNKFKKYIISLVLFVTVPLIVSASLNILFMFKINEFTKIEDAIKAQRNGNVLFNVLLNRSPYKPKMAKLTQPVILSTGSPRSFGVREFFFSEPFYNWGGGSAESKKAFEHFLGSLGSVKKNLRYVLIYLDFWNFMADKADGKVVLQVPRRITKGRRG